MSLYYASSNFPIFKFVRSLRCEKESTESLSIFACLISGSQICNFDRESERGELGELNS